MSFLEVIEQLSARTLGNGNIRALYEAVEVECAGGSVRREPRDERSGGRRRALAGSHHCPRLTGRIASAATAAAGDRGWSARYRSPVPGLLLTGHSRRLALFVMPGRTPWLSSDCWSRSWPCSSGSRHYPVAGRVNRRVTGDCHGVVCR